MSCKVSNLIMLKCIGLTVVLFPIVTISSLLEMSNHRLRILVVIIAKSGNSAPNLKV